MKVKDTLLEVKAVKANAGTKPYLEIGDIDIQTKRYSLKDKPSVSGAKTCNEGTILISTVRPTRGAITILRDNNVAVSSAFAQLNNNTNIINNDYLFWTLNNSKFFEYLGKNSKGATYPTVDKDYIYNYEINVPDLETQTKITLQLNALKSAIETKNEQLIDH